MLIFGPKMARFGPQRVARNFFQNFGFVTFLTFGPLNFK